MFMGTNILINVGGSSGPPFPLNFALPDGTMPLVACDFINNLYYDGTPTPSTLGALVAGTPTTDADGLICTGDSSLLWQGALAAALVTVTGATIAATIRKGNQAAAQFPITIGTDNNSPMYLEPTNIPQAAIQFAGNGGASATFNACDFSVPLFLACGYSTSSPLLTAMFNDQTPQAGTGQFFTQESTGLFGNLHGTSIDPFLGRIATLAVYPSRLTTAQMPTLRTISPFQTPPLRPGLLSADSTFSVLNNATALQIERTQPWSAMANFSTAYPDTVNGGIIFTNVKQAPYSGYEIWVQGTAPGDGRPAGHVCVRIMHDLLGTDGPANAIDVYGGTFVADGYQHMIGYDYDGSSTAAGVKIYVDGVLETNTVKQDNLSASINFNSGPMWIGNQTPGSTFGAGLLNFMAMSNVVRGPAYWAAHASYATQPPVDANTQLYYKFNERTGTTLTDLSSNGFNATITAPIWY